jgi:hypothetical protein
MVVGFSLVLTGVCCFNSCKNQTSGEDVVVKDVFPNRAYQWGKITLEATARDTDRFTPRPTITSRILALIWTSVYDAWTRFDEKAEPVYLSGANRLPEAMRTLQNKEIAISYAAYRAGLHYYFADSAFFRESMISMGLDPDNNSVDPNTPEGIGNLAAKAVIEARLNDGANEAGNVSDAENVRYGDYTGYHPVNNADALSQLDRWQPKYFTDDRTGERFAPGCLSPHWHLVKPLLIDSAASHRPGPPPALGSDELYRQVREVISLQSNLSNAQKALVEFMRDGPSSVQQAGHWLIFAQYVSARDKHTLDEDVKMYFWVEAVAMDAFIACWDTKMYYDFARPFALVRNLFADSLIVGWAGPEEGFRQIKGSEWLPYSPLSFLCPPFPAYTSGHSTVSGACSEALKLFKQSDHFDHSVQLVPGALTEIAEFWGDTVSLHFDTFSEAAAQAGLSRVLGGYHIQADNEEGLNQGQRVARSAWDEYQRLLNGSRE